LFRIPDPSVAAREIYPVNPVLPFFFGAWEAHGGLKARPLLRIRYSKPPLLVFLRCTHGHAHKGATPQRKAPRKIFRAADPNPWIGHHLNLFVRSGVKTVSRVGTKIDLVMPFVDRERLGQFSGTGTEPPNFFDSTALPHETWRGFHQCRLRFDVVILDHTFGENARQDGHLNARLFGEQVARMREEGLLSDGARIFAQHISHADNPPHPDLVEIAAQRGHEVAYDGLTV